jgi:hypothetical protein
MMVVYGSGFNRDEFEARIIDQTLPNLLAGAEALAEGGEP